MASKLKMQTNKEARKIWQLPEQTKSRMQRNRKRNYLKGPNNG